MTKLKTSDLLELAALTIGLISLCLVGAYAADITGLANFGTTEPLSELLTS